MRADAAIPLPLLLGFAAVLARVGGVFVFVPVPGLRKGPAAARVILALSFTLALYPHWPRITAEPAAGAFAVLVAGEAALGSAVGLALGFLMETLAVAAQAIGLQAGFSYAAMINPDTEDESGVLLVFAQLASALLFFAFGLDRRVLGSLAASLDAAPPGSFTLTVPMAENLTRLGAAMFSTGLRLAYPVIALLVLVDFGLALLGRLQPGLQLLTLAFPAKMLAGLAVLAWLMVVLPRVWSAAAETVLGGMQRALGF